MNLIEKIFEKLNISFIWKGNSKKVVKQSGNGFQIQQEQNSVTNVFQIQNLTVTKIEELAGTDTPQDASGLLRSAGQRFIAEQQTKQENLKAIVAKADLAVITDPQQVDQDWFLKWMEISQTVSRENVQAILAKILSGEVKKAGSFSLRALDILKNLSKQELELFQIFCDISFSVPQIGDDLTCVISEPFGSPGQNGMQSIGLNYGNLAALQDAGLIQGDLNSWRQFHIPQMLQIPFTIGSTLYNLKTTDETTTTQPKIKILNFTSAGLELRSVLNIGTKTEYNSKFLEWVNGQWKMIP
ncbi:MAG: DUF2806 domain-containing protein [Caldisericia bacterium]|nr:DUF2806 domain-containing protein [Caldisericia bacterium]